MAVDRTTVTTRIGQGNRERESVRESVWGLTSKRGAVVATVAMLAAYGEGATTARAQSCPPESPPRLYHPRSLVKLGGLGECSTELNSFDKAAWYAGARAGADHLGALAVNLHGEIVGTYLVGSGCLPRPFVYLPNANYGKAAGVHELIHGSGGASNTIGYAWDITDDGLVVGGVGGRPDSLSGGACRAIAWDLAAGCTTTDLDSSSSSPFLWSVAIAAEPFADMGETLDIVGVGPAVCPTLRAGAAFDLATGNASLLDDGGGPPASVDPVWTSYLQGARNWACDIANLTSPVGGFDTPVQIPIGEIEDCESIEQFPYGVCANPFECGFAYKWVPAVPNGVKREYRRDPTAADASDQLTGVRSISHLESTDAGVLDHVVSGYVRVPGGSPCRDVPALWEYGVPATAHLLPLPTGIADATAQRWRQAPVGCGTDVVVGWQMNNFLCHGVVWSRCFGSGVWDFCVHAADELTPQGDVPSGFDVLQIYEVFDTGEMLAIVRDDVSDVGSRGYHAAILGLAGDFNRDWAIGSPNLAILLSSWGSTSSMELDLSQDGVVNGLDLSSLFNLWTGSTHRALSLSCGAAFCLPDSASSSESSQRAPSEALALALAAVGFDSVAAFRAAARELDAAQLEFTCHLMYCFMQVYSENPQ